MTESINIPQEFRKQEPIMKRKWGRSGYNSAKAIKTQTHKYCFKSMPPIYSINLQK